MRNQVRHTIWMEAVSIGWIGLVLGLSLGAIVLYYYLNVIRQDFAGVRLEYEYPSRIALLMVPVMLSAAFISAVGPAETAVRGSLVEALEYE
jgi:ABC-type antimicrobial peptide transport system permease subunit